MTYLDGIVAAHRAAAAQDERRLDDLIEQAAALPPPRGFGSRLTAPGLSVIAEVKRRSPSKGDLAVDLVAGDLARAYERAGAACLSVLTDVSFFGGSPGDLAEARGATTLPALRKDFTVDARDVCDARLMGADAVLLIVAALTDDELARFHALAHRLTLDVLVEVHDTNDLVRAAAVGATLIGVNQRDLVTFEVDRDRAAALRPLIPEGVVTVAESGVAGAADAARLGEAGYDAVLVGESLVTAEDPEAAVRSLRSA